MVVGTYPNIIKPNQGRTEEGVGAANPKTITKDNVQVADASTVIYSDM